MGHRLEFYAVDIREFGGILGAGNRKLLDRVQKDGLPQLLTPQPNRANTLLRETQDSLTGLLMSEEGRRIGARASGTAKSEVEEVPAPVAFAIVGIVRAVGQFIGALTHRSHAGNYFRREFLGREARLGLKSPVDLLALVDRPLLNVAHSGFPCWGGLSGGEVRLIVDGRRVEDMPTLKNPESGKLLYELWGILSASRSFNKDMVTVYL